MATTEQFVDQDKDDPLYWQIRREFEETQRRQNWWQYHSSHGTLKSQRQRELQQLAREAERWVADRVQLMGYETHPTTHKCPFDLWVTDAERAIRLEVKISLYHTGKKGGRYQADIRHHDQAELVVFIARNGRDWPFVIPMGDIAPRRNIAIWSYCPADYTGQWANYLEAWDHLHQALETAMPQARQLTLFE